MLRTIFLGGALSLGLWNGSWAAPPKPAERGNAAPSTPESASDAVARALEKELAGDQAGRLSALRERLSSNPGDAAAHWHLGEVRVGEEWLPYAQVADHGDRWKEMYRYREERARKGATVQDQLFLADGARAHKLFDEERAHLTQVVTLDPAHEEAHQRLGNILVNGQWIARESAVRAMLSQARWQQSLEDHGQSAARLVQRLRRMNPASLAGLADPFAGWSEPDRIPALEQAVGDKGDGVQQAYLRWLAGFDCYEASIALARQAIFSDQDTIRVQATQALKPRPREDYLHDLVASVTEFRPGATPVYSWVDSRHSTAMELEGLDGLHALTFIVRHPIPVEVSRWGGFVSRIDPREDISELPKFNLAVAETRKAVIEIAAATDTLRNERVLRTVSVLAGFSLTTAPDIWKWWSSEEDTLIDKARISLNYEENWYIDRRRIKNSPRPTVGVVGLRKYSCLAAGTPITTELGPKPIESIEPGDRVLAQDVETGELAFKPVFARTVREKAKLYRLQTADNDVTCSQGHPFWINGIGWVQARALQPGMPLHTVLGAVEVKDVESAGEGAVYNLVVADSHTYFVGKDHAFLSHDVTPRQPTNALVPGLQPIWLTPDAEQEEKPLTAR